MLMITEVKMERGKTQNALPYNLGWFGISIGSLLKVFCWLVATI